MKLTFIHGAVAEEACGYPLSPQQLVGQCQTDCHRQAAGNDRIAAVESLFDVKQVH